MKRATTVLVGSMFAATLFAACGDDDKGSDPIDGGGDVAAYCERIAEYRATSDDLDAVFTGDPDPAQVETAFTTMQSMVNDLRDGAPDEIADDVDTMASAIDNVVDVMSKYDWDFMQLATAPEFAQLQQDLEGPEVVAAGNRLTEYSETTCGLPAES
jgi:hypothetical protein